MKRFTKLDSLYLKIVYLLFFMFSVSMSGQTFTDNAANYGGSWSNGSNQGTGFGAWSLTAGSNSGSFIGNPANNGMGTNGIGTTAFGMFATGTGYFNAYRPINNGIQVGDTFSFHWAINWDALGGAKGFDLRSGGTTIFNVNNGNSATITTTNGTANTNYGTAAMLVTITRTSANLYSFSMTSRSGGATYTTTISSAATIDGFNIYIGNQNGDAQRNMYFNGFSITKPITVANGNWNQTATWLNNTVPPAGASVTIDHNVIVNTDISLRSVVINSGKTLTASDATPRTITISNDGSITNNNGTFVGGNGTIAFAGAATVSGTITFNNSNLSGGVNFGTGSTINGTLTINNGGFVNSNAPFYSSSSILQYSTGTSYGRGTEWSATSGAGYPNNVTIQGNTTLNLVNGSDSYKKAGGSLTVASGSTLSINSLTAQNGSTGVGVEFVGNIINSGNITLSGTTNKRLKGVTLTNNGTITLAANIGADLELTGDYTDNGTFNANQRAVFFTGTGTQTISGTATAPFNIDYIVITKPSGIVQLGVDLLTGAPNGGNGITLSSANDIFDLNGKTFTLGTASQTCTIFGSGLIRSASNNPGSMIINGTGAMGTLTFETANNTLAGLTINRTSGTGTAGVTLGSTLNVTTTLDLTSTTTLTLGGNLTVSASSSNTVNGKIAGTGALVKTGSGTLTLTAANGNNTTNTYSAGTTVNEAGTGTIAVTGLTNITSASIASDSQSVTFSTTTPADGTYQLLPNTLTVGTQNFNHNAAPTKAVTFNYTNSTITVGPATITTSAISPTTYCAGAAVTISFTTNGPLSGTYTAQLSDATGSFTSPVAIGTSNTNTISGTIPLAASSGNGYRIRVVNIGNSITGSDNGANITVNPILTASVSIAITAGAQTICAGTSVTFTATPTNGGAAPSYQWYVGTTAVGSNSATFTTSTLTNGDTVSVVMTSNATPCLTGSPATSNSIAMTVSNNTSWTGAVSNLWSNGANWSCGSVPSGTSNITISSGTPTLDTNFTVGSTGSLTLDGDASLIINSTASLTVAGSANFNARPVTFKSDVSGTAEFGPLTGTLSGATNVTTERYFSARRAFRFTSSAVTTSTPIRTNWQEGVNNSNTTFSNNLNPNPGFGTHITGAGGSANGFDTTSSNASSLFTFNNATPAWTAVTNTSQNILTAGVPYRINVRGDRSIDMSLTNPTATATVLRATGTLATGTVTTSNLSSTAAAYNFIGNPYQAPVNMKTVLDTPNSNLNNQFYYVWDPTLASRGAYSTVDLSTINGTPNVGSANKFLQPGQACFVRTATNGAASITFEESYKDLSGSNISLFRNSNQSTSATSIIKMRLYDSNSLALNQTPLDGSLILFDDSNNNGVDQNDGAKFTNPDEMFSTFNNGTLISIEKRMQPTTSDIIPIRISQYRGTNYTIVAQGENLNGIPAYLHDQFLQTYTEIPQSGSVNYPYTVVTTNTQTSATDRFRIVYSNPLLNTANNEWKNFTLYPNPSKQGNFNIILGQPLENGKVTIYNTLGVKVYNQDLENTIENSITPNQSMPTGVYYVEIQNGSERSIKKLIIE
jgi:hypothetical protein